ncbi:MAG: MucB/RseB C-terminal domain-containing protein [Candidatus Competibacteraceae bacterium]
MYFPALRLAAVLILVLLPVKYTPAESVNDAQQWLERMIQAAHALNYEGIFVYVQGQHLEAMRVIHAGGANSERQRLFSLNGSPREIVVADNRVICMVPEQQTSMGNGYRRSPFPITLPLKLDRLESHYDFKLAGEDRVAGLDTRVIVIQPRDKLRFGYRLWLDQNNGMVLRSALFDEAGQWLEQMMFTSVQYKQDIDPALLNPPAAAEPAPPATEPAPEEAKPIVEESESSWRLVDAELPQGFSRVTHYRLPAKDTKRAPEHIVLTDGLATVSIFLEPLAGSHPLLQGPAQMGAMNALGKVFNDYQVLVVGEVPQAAVQMIAAALRPPPAAAK